MKFINLRAPYMIFGYLVVFWGPFCVHFWCLTFSKMFLEWECVIWGCLFRAPYMIFGCLVVLGVLFGVNFWVFEIFEKKIWNENV